MTPIFKKLNLNPSELNFFSYYATKYGMRAGLGSGNIPENIFCTSEEYRSDQFLARLSNNMFAVCEYDSRQMAFRILATYHTIDGAFDHLILGHLGHLDDIKIRWTPSDWINI
jgi:hypothetical protein